MKNNQEINETCIDKVQEFCQISDTDREIMSYVFPHTMQAIDDVKKVHPEAVIKVIVVVDRNHYEDDATQMVHYETMRPVVSAACDGETKAFNDILKTYKDDTYCDHRGLPIAIKTVNAAIDSEMFGAALSDIPLPAVITMSTDKYIGPIVPDEMCIGVFIEDWLLDITAVEIDDYMCITSKDADIANAIFKMIVSKCGEWNSNVKKKNDPQSGISERIEHRDINTHDKQLPQGLFDNPQITMVKLLKDTDDILEHFDTILLADTDGIDPSDFETDVTFNYRHAMSREFVNEEESLMISHLLTRGDVAALAFLYEEHEGSEEIHKYLKTGIAFNCDHTDVGNALTEVGRVWERIRPSIDTKIDELSGDDPYWHFGWKYPYVSRLWDYLLEKEKIDPSCNVIPITTEIIDGYVKYAVNDALESLSKYAEERKKKENKTE